MIAANGSEAAARIARVLPGLATCAFTVRAHASGPCGMNDAILCTAFRGHSGNAESHSCCTMGC